MPRHAKTKSVGAAGDKKAPSTWRGLPAKLRGLPGSEQLFSMWGNDSFRQPPPVMPTHSSVWDVRDPSRTLPYSFQTPTPIAPPPMAGIAFVTEARAARSSPSTKQRLPRLLPAIRPPSHSSSDSLASSSPIAPAMPEQSYLYTYQAFSPSGYPPGSVLSWPPPPPPPGYVKDEPMVVELPPESYASGSECDTPSSERSGSAVSKAKAPFVYLPIPPYSCSPPLSPWSSPGRTCLSPLLPGEGLPSEAQESSAVARAQSEPLLRGEEALSVYEACRQRKLPPMVFKNTTPLPEVVIDLVLPALRAPSSAPDQQDSGDEGRDFDASCQRGRKARYSPYQTTHASRGAHQEGEEDLPPLRLLLAQLEIDEHRRAQSEAQYQPSSEPLLADKLLEILTPDQKQKRKSPTTSRRRRAATTANAATPVPTSSLSGVARLAPRPLNPGQIKLDAVTGPVVAIPCTTGARTTAAVHPQGSGLHPL